MKIPLPHILSGMALVLSLPLPALPHDLATTIPAHDAVIKAPPEQLHFLFMAPVTITHITIQLGRGDTAAQKITVNLPRDSLGRSLASGERVDLDIPLLGPDTYTVVWQAMSIDGHFIVDYFTFTIEEN